MIPEKFLPFYKSTGLCTDTRKLEKDNLFVCIRGEQFNANTFANNALHNGACHVIVDDPQYFVGDGTMTLVQDSVTYLQDLARFHRRQYDIPVIGITGSNGKTTTKELINAVLSQKYSVLATEGNLNNHLGVPFTLLRLSDKHEIAIIEMGANKPGDIAELCAIAEPTHGIITNIGKAHLEGFGDFDGVIKTKLELYNSIQEAGGTLFVNGTDELLMSRIPENTDVVKYNTFESEVSGELLELTPFITMRWKFNGYRSPVLCTQLIGKYNFTNFLAAIAIGIFFDVENEKINLAIESYTPTNRRSQVKKTAKNTLILDCYNANPTSMESAIISFSDIEHSDKLLILGSMKELGDLSAKEHQKVIDLLEKYELKGYLVGEEFEKINSPAILKHFGQKEDALNYFEKNPQDGKLILLKGSRSVGLEVLEDKL